MNTRQEALLLGQKLLQLYGFNGFSFQDLADSLGIRKASLHYHFSSKQELALAIVEEFTTQFTNWSLKVQNKSDEEQLRSYFRIFLSMAEENKKICPIGAFCIEIDNLDESVIDALGKFYHTQKTWLSQRLKKIHSKDYLKKIGGEEKLAQFIISTIQGALQTARLQKSPALAKKHLKDHVHILESSLI